MLLPVSADPHPGNLAVEATDGGRIIYYDFGESATESSPSNSKVRRVALIFKRLSSKARLLSVSQFCKKRSELSVIFPPKTKLIMIYFTAECFPDQSADERPG